MPKECWAYLLAITLGFGIGWTIANGRLSRKAPTELPGSGRGLLSFIPDGLFLILTTVGTSLLGHWSVSEAGPELGFFWVAGVFSGGAFRAERAARVIAAPFYLGLSAHDRHSLLSVARASLLTRGVDATKESVQLGEREIRERRRAQDRVDELAILKRDLRAAKAALDDAEHRAARALHFVRELGAILSAASVADYARWPEREFPSILQVLVNRLALLGDPDGRKYAVAVYFARLWADAPDDVRPFAFSRPSERREGWVVDTPLKKSRSILALARHVDTPIHWPEQKEALKARFRDHVKETGNEALWPASLVIPIPFPDPNTGSKYRREAYGALVIRRRFEVQVPGVLEEAAILAASLIDLLVQLSAPPQVVK